MAFKEQEIVGYKIGYEKDSINFYSWLGGVSESHRNAGIAQQLIDEQIRLVRSAGYEKVQTKTFNKWKEMLILNIKNDYEIIDCYNDSENNTAIILEKDIIDY